MQQINILPELLKAASVSELTLDTLPKILQTITNNQILLNNQALDAVTTLLKSTPAAVTKVYDAIQDSVQKANSRNDKQSLKYIKELINVFKSSGIDDKRIGKLLKKIEKHEHEIRLEKTKGSYSVAKWALGVVGFIVAIAVNNKTEKRNFWEK